MTTEQLKDKYILLMDKWKNYKVQDLRDSTLLAYTEDREHMRNIAKELDLRENERSEL